MSIYKSDQNLWMQKYRYTLQRFEKEEKEWRKKEGILKLIATWLILAADQRDELLNNDLQELRSLLRNNQKASTLQNIAERLGVSITRLNKERKNKPDNSDCIELFVRVLDTLGIDLQAIVNKQSIIEALNANQGTRGQSGLVEALAELVGKSLEPRPAIDQGQQDSHAKLKIASETIAESAPKLHEIFTHLIHMLEFPKQIRAQADVIIERMSRGVSADQVSMYLAEIVDLVLQTRLLMQAEKREMERFLERLSDQLSDIDGYLMNQEISERQTKELREKLSDSLDDEVRVIETTLHEASDLETFKSAIQVRLDAIHGHLAEERKLEVERVQKAEAEIQRLQARLKATEQVTAELCEKLTEEREQAIRDPLTGLYNRIAYEERLHQEIKRWQRYQTPLSLVILDIDHFKKVNDNYGHKTGDRLLKFLADALHSHIRETDMLVRFGGEEFVLLASDTSGENALILAEKLRETVQRCNFYFAGERIPISISCGVSSVTEGDTVEDFFERADKALYKAKAEGRNRCLAA